LDPLVHTSRKPIPDVEVDGEDAFFINIERLSADMENGKFFHFEQEIGTGVANGLSFEAVDDVIRRAKIPVLILPVDSVGQLEN
jgi:guanylate kinase